MKKELKKKRSKPVGSGVPPDIMTRMNTDAKFSSVGVKTNWSGMRSEERRG